MIQLVKIMKDKSVDTGFFFEQMAALDVNPHPVLDDLDIKNKEDPCLFFYYSVMIPRGELTTLIRINRMKPEICKIFV